MKKILLASLCTIALCLGFQKTHAQAPAFKIGVFDMDLMVQAMPEYRRVDSLSQLYERDTLGAEQQVYQSEYQRLDSTLKADSAKGVAKTIMDYNNQQKQQMMYNLIYWQQIAQQKSEQYKGQLASPLYQRVVSAYKKVLTVKKYNLILKPNTYEVGFPLENMFPLVAKELNITLPPGLMVDPNQALQDQPAQKAGAGKP